MEKLVIRAGPAAFQKIQRDGLAPADISAVFGASGSAKWLAIAGLDSAIFARWLGRAEHGIHLYGTSIGAWKLAAAAQRDPAQALSRLADGYIEQHYGKNIGHADIRRESNCIFDKFLPTAAIAEVLSSPRYLFHCGAVRCRGLLASETKALLALGMAQAAITNVFGRRAMNTLLERVVFTDPRQPAPVDSSGDFSTLLLPLSTDNFVTAITASGSIPYVMAGVEYLFNQSPSNKQRLMLRDGGLLDYHPVPHRFWHGDGLILYPHFYPHCTAGWFDKFYASRRATARQLGNVVMISPSPEFVESLPQQRIPDRLDFKRYLGRDAERQRLWRIALEKSHELGEAFLGIVDGGDIQAHIKPL